MFLIRWDIRKLKYSHSEDLISQFLCGLRHSTFHTIICGRYVTQILHFDKARLRIGAFLYKSSNDHLKNSVIFFNFQSFFSIWNLFYIWPFLFFRLRLKFSCMMELSRYPLDTQVCTMQISSCKYDLKILNYWLLKNEVT